MFGDYSFINFWAEMTAQDAPRSEWAAKLDGLALGAWQKDIENAIADSRPLRFRLHDEEYEWVQDVLVPFLKREGLVVTFERHTCGREDEYYLCVALQ